LDKIIKDEMSVDEMTENDMPVDKMTLGDENTECKLYFDKMTRLCVCR
jgi:hypothetical protein